MTVRQNFASYLDTLMREKGDMSESRLAELTDVDNSYISIMLNKNFIPSRRIALKLGAILGHQNELLLHAGYAPTVDEKFLESHSMTGPIELIRAINLMVKEPYNLKRWVDGAMGELRRERK